MAVGIAFLMVHTVVVEPYLGDTAYGGKYGPAITVACFIDDKRRRVRNDAGEEVVSESTFYTDDMALQVPIRSKVTVNGRTATVITVARRDGGGMPTPDHQEVALT